METSLTVNNSEGETFSIQHFDHAQRIAKVLAESDLVPSTYKGKIANCLIALEMSNRIGASPLMVMQNLHVIQGCPSWSSPFIIASLNTCGRFQPLKFREVGERGKDTFGYEAHTKDKSGAELVGPAITMAMVKAEGWLSKNGSKWQTMPELMFRYRAAAFFGRLYAPDILMGMQTAEEVVDVESVTVNEATKADKEAERIELMIKDAKTLHDLIPLKDHIGPAQMELFQERMRDLS